MAGCPTLAFEAGEVWKVEPSVVDYSIRIIDNVLASLDMIEGPATHPPFQTVIKQTRWIRASGEAFCDFTSRRANWFRKIK